MEDIPSLTIKSNKDAIKIVAKYKSHIVEHDILLKLVLGYYWRNNLPFAEKFMELLGTVIKRSLAQVFPFKKLFVKFNIESNDTLEESSIFNITLLEVKADEVILALSGNEIALTGIDNRGAMSKMTGFRRKVSETIEKEFIV
jgi:hypothetical protein